MKQLAVLALFLTLTAATCAEDPAPTTPILYHGNKSITEWRTRGLAFNYRQCSEYQLSLVLVHRDTLPGHCGVDAQLYACLQGNTVYMDRSIDGTVRADYVIEHELRHWMAGCGYGTVDGNHSDPRYWYDYCGGAAGCQSIRE